MIDRLIQWWKKWKKTNDNNDKETSELSLKEKHFTKWYEKEREKKEKAKENRRLWLDAKTCGVLGSSIGLLFGGAPGAIAVGGLGMYCVNKINDFIDRFHDFSDEDKEKYNFFKTYEDKFKASYKNFCDVVKIDYDSTLNGQLSKIQESIKQCYKECNEANEQNTDMTMEERITEYIKENHRCLSEFVDGKEGFFKTIFKNIGNAITDYFMPNKNYKKVVVDTTNDVISVWEKIDPQAAISYIIKNDSINFFGQDLRTIVSQVVEKINKSPKELKVSFDTDVDSSKKSSDNEVLHLTPKIISAIYRYMLLKRNKLTELSKEYNYKEQVERFGVKNERIIAELIGYQNLETKPEESLFKIKKGEPKYNGDFFKKLGPITLKGAELNIDSLYKKIEDEIIKNAPDLSLEEKTQVEQNCFSEQPTRQKLQSIPLRKKTLEGKTQDKDNFDTCEIGEEMEELEQINTITASSSLENGIQLQKTT